MGIRRTEGSEVFCKVVDAGFLKKRLYLSRDSEKLQELTLWTTEGTSAQGLHVSMETGAAVSEGGRCEVNRHLQGNGHQVTEDLRLWKGELLQDI